MRGTRMHVCISSHQREPVALFGGHQKAFDWTRKLVFERPKQHLQTCEGGQSVLGMKQIRSPPCLFYPPTTRSVRNRTTHNIHLAVAANAGNLVVALVVVVHPPAPHHADW